MDISKLSSGPNPPWDVHVLVEIPQGSTEPVKYDFDQASGAMTVERFLHTAMFCPANYGFIPHALARAGDSLDALVVSGSGVVPGSVIRSRPIGALVLRDEHGEYEKIIAVPVDALHPYYPRANSCSDLPETLRDQIAHFFQHYKDLEKGKWATVSEWLGPDAAARLVAEAIERSKPLRGKKKQRPSSADVSPPPGAGDTA